MPRRSITVFSFARARTTPLLVAAVLLLSGCQGGVAPSSQTSGTGSTTASPTLSSTTAASASTPSPVAVYKPADAKGKAENVPVPVMPELAKENSKAGLEAFIGYWYATYSYAIETGELALWQKITNMVTTVAVAHEESVKLNYVDGRWLAGGRLTTPAVEVAWNETGGAYSTRVQVIQEAIQYYDADGTKGQEDSASTNTADAVFSKYIDGAWTVTDYGSIVG